MGIEVELFTLADVAVHYQCMVCKEIPEVATSALRVMCGQGHILCSTCIDPVSSPGKCYLCSGVVRGDLLYAKHPAIERLIKDLEVRCTKSAEGCQWIGKCIDLRSHEKQKCEHRIEKCCHQARGCKIADLPAKIQSHQSLCAFRDTACKRKRTWDGKLCEVVHRVNETEKHNSKDCRYHTCAYSSSGCRFYGKLEDVQKHQRLYCAPIHAKIAKLEATVAKDTLIAETKRINKIAEKKVSHYKKRIAGLEQEVKLAKNKAHIQKMQFAAGMPNLTGQTISTPDSSDSSCSSTDITIRLTTQVDPHIYHYHESDDASETVWNEVHWAEPDWKDADHQAQVVKAKKSVLTPRV